MSNSDDTVKLFTREELDAAVAAERAKILAHIKPLLDWVDIAMDHCRVSMTLHERGAYLLLREAAGAARGNSKPPPT